MNTVNADSKNEGGTLPHHAFADAFHVYLIEPHDSLNIGAVARAMMNLGFEHLHIVRPQRFDRKKCEVTARWASSLIEKATIHDNYADSLSTMREVIGFGSRKNFNASANRTLPEWVNSIKAHFSAPVGLLFGPEDTGLTNEHLELCRWVVRIPSSEQYPSFNLAQSVLLALYELSRTVWDSVRPIDSSEMPSWNEFQQLDRILDTVLTESGFYRMGSPETIPPLVKNLFRRTQPDAREMRVLLALFSRLEKTIAIRKKAE